MVDNSTFEKIVADHKSLNSLINNHKFGGVNSVKHSDEMKPEFIDWISPKYYDAFVNIYEKNRANNLGSICSVIRVNFLANKQTKDKIVEFLMPGINESIAGLEVFLAEVTRSKYRSIEFLKEFGIGINLLTVTVFKSVEVEALKEKKAKYAELLLAIADRFKNVSKMRDEINFNLYEKVNTALKTLNLKGDVVERVKNHEKRLERKAVWYVVGVVVVILLLALKYMNRLS